MTHLLHYLLAHHIPYGIIAGTPHHQHLVYVAFHAHCRNMHELTAWAKYGARVVAYCYGK